MGDGERDENICIIILFGCSLRANLSFYYQGNTHGRIYNYGM